MRKRLLFVGVILLCLFTNCSKDDKTSPCGSKTSASNFWLRVGNSLFQNFHGLPYTYMEGNNRVFQWSDEVTNVCPDEHVKVECEVEMTNAASPIGARGRVDWLILFERKITMTRNGNVFKGSDEVGLKQAFNQDPASFFPVVEVFFPTQGSYSADSTFLLQHVAKVTYKADYKAFKP